MSELLDQRELNILMRRAESVLDHQNFDELLELAVSVCLRHPIEFDETFQGTSGEAAIVEKFGLAGIRAAYELAHGLDNLSIDHNSEEYQQQDLRPIDTDLPFIEPEMFSGSLNVPALRKAEQFGAAITDEMFRIIGQDAYEKARQLAAAETDEEQMKIIFWLSDRLRELANAKNEEAPAKDGSDKYLYTPIRLSPTLIGNFPKHNFAPTCLGISIAAASFLKRAGIEHLHAGVMRNRMQDILVTSSMGIADLPDIIQNKTGESAPPAFINTTRRISEDMLRDYAKNRGYHAAVLLRLKSGSWVQMDSNYCTTIQIATEESNEKLTETYNTLHELKTVAPGLEVTLPLATYATWTDRYIDLAENSDAKYLPDPKKLSTFLRELDPDTESIPQLIYEEFIQPFFKQKFSKRHYKHTLKDLEKRYHGWTDETSEPIVQKAYYGIFESFAEEFGLQEMIRRCKIDEHYLERRVTDIRQLPLAIFAALITLEFPVIDSERYFPYPVFEVGLPDTRIGLSVLSDFAVYTESDLNPSFWLTNWASLIPKTETLHYPHPTTAQQAIISNNIGLINAKSLRYANIYGILNEFHRNNPESIVNPEE